MNYRPSYTVRVQTDGSFGIKYQPISRTAVILTDCSGIRYSLCKTYFDHKNSTESEWCSVLDGLNYCLKKDEGAVELENDNLGVMNSLIQRKPPRHGYLADYYGMIHKQLTLLEYVSIRWIPRQLNKADGLFRL
jgi:ribonuclease HI